MPRIKINVPGPSHFETFLQIRVTDLNYGDHLANDAILGLCHEARVRFLRELGLAELNNDGIGLIMVDAGVEYKSQAALGEQIKIAITIDNLRDIGLDFFYEIRSNDGRLIARIKTGHVGFDYSLKRMAALPDIVTNAVFDHLHEQPTRALAGAGS